MATVAATAIKRSLATNRIAAAAEGIAKQLGVEAISLPLTNRDPAQLHAEQLVTLADYLENIWLALDPKAAEAIVDVNDTAEFDESKPKEVSSKPVAVKTDKPVMKRKGG